MHEVDPRGYRQIRGHNAPAAFDHGTRAEATRRKYTETLRRITCDILEDVPEGDFEAGVEQFVQCCRDDPGRMLNLLAILSWKLRARS